jgi:hypothetical protein
MKRTSVLLLSVLAVGCATSGPPPSPGPAERVEPEPSAQAAPPAMTAEPAEPGQPTVAGNDAACSAVCDRVASCQLASKESCMPVCRPQMPALTAEQEAQVIPMMASMPCEDMAAQFGGQSGQGAPPAAAPPSAPETDAGDDGQDS